jgi:hypothetical protein
MSEKLLPCPFCGTHVAGPYFNEYIGDRRHPHWSVDCSNCPAGIIVDGETPDGLIAAWNARPTPDGDAVRVPREVLDLYHFMVAAFVPQTSQQQEIAIALRKAKKAMATAPLASPAQGGEPVAFCDLTPAGTVAVVDGRYCLSTVQNEHYPVPLYTAPPAAGAVVVPAKISGAQAPDEYNLNGAATYARGWNAAIDAMNAAIAAGRREG